MYIVIINFLLLLDTSVTGQSALWVLIIMVVLVATYLLLRKLNALQDDVIYGENDSQYIPAERLKSRAIDYEASSAENTFVNSPTITQAEPNQYPLNTSLTFVEYISVAKPKTAELIAEKDTPIAKPVDDIEPAAIADTDQPEPGESAIKGDIPKFIPPIEQNITQHIAGQEPVTATANDSDMEAAINEPIIAAYETGKTARAAQIDADQITGTMSFDEEPIIADDIIPEQHTEAIAADELMVSKLSLPSLNGEKHIIEEHAAEPAFTEKIPAPLLINETPVTDPLFNQDIYNQDIHINDTFISKTGPDVNAVLNSLSDIIFEYDERKYCVNIWYNKSNPSVIDLEIFRGKTVTEAMGVEKAKVINDAIDLVTANIKPATIEFPSFYGPGKWFKSKISPVFDDKYNFTGHTTSLVSDISEQRRLDAEMLQKHLLLIAAQKIARLGDWVYDLDTKQTTWSDNLYVLLDNDPQPPNFNHFEYYISHVVADDRRAVYQFFADVSGDTHLVNYHRVLTDKGNLKYFRIVRGEPVKGNDGNIIRTTGIIQDVSENQEIEKNIRKTQAELFEAQAIAKIGNWKWYTANKELTLTDELYKIYELDNQVLNKGISPFKILMKFVHPDDKQAVLTFVKNPVNMRRMACEYRILTSGGKLKYLNLVIVKVNQREDGRVRTMAGTLQDITERREVELNIQHKEDNYKLILESIKLAAISLDKKGEIIFCNKYLAGLLGYEQQELIGLNWYDKFISENLIPVFKEWYQSNNFKTEYVSPVICRDGDERVISWQNTTLYDDDGQIKQTTSIGEDITDQQKNREFLISEKEKAERLSMFKSDFMSVISHEIRTPMNAVIGATNLLMVENPRPDQLNHLHNLKSSGENLIGIIDNILDYNTIETGKLELNKAPFDIYQLVADIKQTFLAEALEKKIELFAETEDRIPKDLIGDTFRLNQILTNLISNAIKFTNKGSVTLSVQEESKNDNFVKLNFTVADTGIGIDQKSLQKIFEPFVQQPKHRDNSSTGLGLAIIKRLVELHDSKINVKSTINRGTQFTFTIEFEYKDQQTTKSQPAETIAALENTAPSANQADLSGMRVLVVDDNKLNMLIACRFLDKWHVTTNEASNGHMATEMVDGGNYDLILMDLQMPVMDGFAASKIIKEKYPSMPIIALTADAMSETFAKTIEYGFDDYLVKPFMPEALLEKVSKFFKG